MSSSSTESRDEKLQLLIHQISLHGQTFNGRKLEMLLKIVFETLISINNDDEGRADTMDKNGTLSFDNPSQDDPSRHDTVDGCRYGIGYVDGREGICVICQEEIYTKDQTVIHCECKSALHEECFDSLVATSTNLHETEPEPSKCPLCRGKMRPWPTLGCDPSIYLEVARIEALRASIEAQGLEDPYAQRAAREMARRRQFLRDREVEETTRMAEADTITYGVRNRVPTVTTSAPEYNRTPYPEDMQLDLGYEESFADFYQINLESDEDAMDLDHPDPISTPTAEELLGIRFTENGLAIFDPEETAERPVQEPAQPFVPPRSPAELQTQRRHTREIVLDEARGVTVRPVRPLPSVEEILNLIPPEGTSVHELAIQLVPHSLLRAIRGTTLYQRIRTAVMTNPDLSLSVRNSMLSEVQDFEQRGHCSQSYSQHNDHGYPE